MRLRRLEPLLVALPFGLAGLAFLLATNTHLGAPIGLDYEVDAATAVSALGHGDVGGALSNQPLMGLFSIIIRAPFAALAPSANLDAQYLLGLLPCAAVVVAVLAWLRRLTRARRPGGRAAALLPWLVLGSAPCLEAVLYGHPEEMVGGALCVGAGLAALQRRSVLCGLLLGLAVATKQWGLFAVAPVLVAGTGSRWRTLVATGVVAAALTLPLMLGNQAQFTAVSRVAAQAPPAQLTPLSGWAVLSPRSSPAPHGIGGFEVMLTAPHLATSLSRPLMAAAILLACLLGLRPRRRPEDVLALLAIVFLARCVFDPVDNVYYHAPFLLSLAAWEALRSPRLPVLSLFAAGVLGVVALVVRVDPGSVALPLIAGAALATAVPAMLLWRLLERPGTQGSAAVSDALGVAPAA